MIDGIDRRFGKGQRDGRERLCQLQVGARFDAGLYRVHELDRVLAPADAGEHRADLRLGRPAVAVERLATTLSRQQFAPPGSGCLLAGIGLAEAGPAIGNPRMGSAVGSDDELCGTCNVEAVVDRL